MDCDICLDRIKKRDNYVRITDYKKGKFYKEGFYHNKCYIEKIKPQLSSSTKKLQLIAAGIMGRANRMLDSLENEKELKT